jgi:formate/nitrite transporter FocA (FNT family)
MMDEQILLPNGRPAVADTERKRERFSEDEEYVPVIIKRTDEKRRHPDDTLETAIDEGLEQINRSTTSLALSSIAAGLIVGFSPMAVAVVTTAFQGQTSPLMIRVATALVYPLGFVICIMSGAQLYTEHTATAVYPVLDRRATLRQLLRLWAIVIAGNLAGAGLGGLIHTAVADVVQAREGYIAMGHHMVKFASAPLLISAVLAGWLMALGAWLAVSSPRMGSQMMCVYVVTFLIGIGGLHHSIAGSAEIFTAFFMSGEIAALQIVRVVSLALIGNLLGGSFFVALLNYAHIRRTQASAS